MSVLVSAFILTIIILAGKETKATTTCQYGCSSSGTCTYNARTCPDICCGDKTKGYDAVCCTSSSSSNDGAVAGGAVAGIICCIVFLVLCYWCCCRTPTRVTTTTVHTVVY